MTARAVFVAHCAVFLGESEVDVIARRTRTMLLFAPKQSTDFSFWTNVAPFDQSCFLPVLHAVGLVRNVHSASGLSGQNATLR